MTVENYSSNSEDSDDELNNLNNKDKLYNRKINKCDINLYTNEFETIFHDYSRIIFAAAQSKPFQRSINELSVLSQFLQTIPEFLKFNNTELELACQAAKLCVLEESEMFLKKFMPILQWIFCLNGALWKKTDEKLEKIGVGQYFGADFYSSDTMIATYDLFADKRSGAKLLTIHLDDLRKCSQKNSRIYKRQTRKRTLGSSGEYINSVEETDNEDVNYVAAVYESKSGSGAIENGGASEKGDSMHCVDYVLTKATSEQLKQHLLTTACWVHPKFVEDIFLTHKSIGANWSLVWLIETVFHHHLFQVGEQSHSQQQSQESNMDFVNSDSNSSLSSGGSTGGSNSVMASQSQLLDTLFRGIAEVFPIIERNSQCWRVLTEIVQRLQRSTEHYGYHLIGLLEVCTYRASVRCCRVRLSELSSRVTAVEGPGPGPPDSANYYTTRLYINHSANDYDDDRLHEGDLIVSMDDYSQFDISLALIDKLLDVEESVIVSISVRNDLLGYHELVLKDLPSIGPTTTATTTGPANCSSDTYSVSSTPGTTRYSRCYSDKGNDTHSIYTNDSDSSWCANNNSSSVYDCSTISTTNNKANTVGSGGGSNSYNAGTTTKAGTTAGAATGTTLSNSNSVVLPQIFGSMQIGTMGRYFKKSKLNLPSTVNYDMDYDATQPQRAREARGSLTALSNHTLSKYSRRFKFKRLRKSIGSNPDLLQDDLSFDAFKNFSEQFDLDRSSLEYPITLRNRNNSMSGVAAGNTTSSAGGQCPPATSASGGGGGGGGGSTKFRKKQFPIRIYWRPEFLKVSSGGTSEIGTTATSSSASSTSKGGNDDKVNGNEDTNVGPPRCIHLMIERTTNVMELIVLILIHIDVLSASSNEFYLVEISSVSGTIKEKILRHQETNLLTRIRNGSSFYIKHRRRTGSTFLSCSEIDKILADFNDLTLTNISSKELAIQFFLHSHKLLCRIQPMDVLDYITGGSSKCRTLKGKKSSVSGPKNVGTDLERYISLSDFYKHWVIWEICSQTKSTSKRVNIIHYFINFALNCFTLGHVDLFFSVLCALDSVEVSRLSHTWDKVANKNKKLLGSLRSNIDVSGNLRNLRLIHQRMHPPFIPVTAMFIKDLTVVEETQPTCSDSIQEDVNVEIDPNNPLVSVEKLRRMAQLTRAFVSWPICKCAARAGAGGGSVAGDKPSAPLLHGRSAICLARPEHENELRHVLENRLDVKSGDAEILAPLFRLRQLGLENSTPQGRKFSFAKGGGGNFMGNRVATTPNVVPNVGPSTSIESIPDMVNANVCPTPTASNSSKQYQKFVAKEYDKMLRDLKLKQFMNHTLHNEMIDQQYLNQLSLQCEPMLASQQQQQQGLIPNSVINKTRFSMRHPKVADAERSSIKSPINSNAMSEKAAEVLGLKAKPTIHTYKKSIFN